MELFHIFVDTITNPLFPKEYVMKEINAVDSEFNNYKNTAIFRHVIDIIYNLNYQHFAESHTNKFGAGNKQTLDIPNIYEMAIQYYKTYYQPKNMTLVIYHNSDINIIKNAINDTFGIISNLNDELSKIDERMFTSFKDLNDNITVIEIQKNKETEINFFWTIDNNNNNGIKIEDIHLYNIMYVLRTVFMQYNNNFLSQLSNHSSIYKSSHLYWDPNYSNTFEFQLFFTLYDSPNNENDNNDYIIKLLNDYLIYLRNNIDQFEKLYNEMRQEDKIKFTLVKQELGLDELINNTNYIKPKNFIKSQYIYKKWSSTIKTLILNILNHIVNNNPLIVFINNYDKSTLKFVDKVYDVPYNIIENYIPKPISNEQFISYFKFPDMNKYLPKTLTLHKAAKFKYPQFINNSYYFIQYIHNALDVRMKLQFPLMLNLDYSFPKNRIIVYTFYEMLYHLILQNKLEQYIEVDYDLRILNIFKINIISNNDYIKDIYYEFIKLFDLIDEKMLIKIKNQLKSWFINEDRSYEYNSLYHTLFMSSIGLDISLDDNLILIDEVLLEDIQLILSNFKNHKYCDQIYIGGNLTENMATDLFNSLFKNNILEKCAKDYLVKYSPINEETIIRKNNSQYYNQQTSAILFEYSLYKKSHIKYNVYFALIAMILRPLFFDELRTNQQIAYHVHTSSDSIKINNEDTLYSLNFYILSFNTKSDGLIKKVKSFINSIDLDKIIGNDFSHIINNYANDVYPNMHMFDYHYLILFDENNDRTYFEKHILFAKNMEQSQLIKFFNKYIKNNHHIRILAID